MRITLFGDSNAELTSKPSIPLRILELYAYLCTQRGLEKADLLQPELHNLRVSGHKHTFPVTSGGPQILILACFSGSIGSMNEPYTV